jgi:hypothetical protein
MSRRSSPVVRPPGPSRDAVGMGPKIYSLHRHNAGAISGLPIRGAAAGASGHRLQGGTERCDSDAAAQWCGWAEE